MAQTHNIWLSPSKSESFSLKIQYPDCLSRLTLWMSYSPTWTILDL